jgi:hypothetical protein
MTPVEFKPESLQQARWWEYVIRFVFGGLVTVMAGIVAKIYGPVVGGLFLAFPSIFPASVTLVHTHKKRREQNKGKSEEESDEKGTRAAWKTAEGAALGSVGLFCFGLVIWLLPRFLPPWLVLFVALVAWVAGALLAYFIRDWFLSREKGEKEDDYEEESSRPAPLKAGTKDNGKNSGKNNGKSNGKNNEQLSIQRTIQKSSKKVSAKKVPAKKVPAKKVPAKKDTRKPRG